jgi:alpha-D-ribose 1-methylphosphonate 5-triphosphate synthase subunit PhnL
MMNSHTVLRVENFAKQFFIHEQQKVIPSSSHVNLTVESGQLTALVGPTGSGKSSVLKGIYRSYLPSSGSLLFTTSSGETIDLATADEHQILALRRNEISFVTQFLHCLPRQKTEDIVAQPLIQKGAAYAEAITHAQATLAALNIPERLWGISPATFSGGEKQRVNLARGLIAKPRLLLLDEPTASLDATTTSKVLEMIVALKRDNTAILAIFHHMEQVELVADQVVTLTPPALTESLLENIA